MLMQEHAKEFRIMTIKSVKEILMISNKKTFMLRLRPWNGVIQRRLHEGHN